MKSERNDQLLYAIQKTKLDIGEMNMVTVDSSWSFPNLRASFTRVYIPLEGEAYVSAGDEHRRLEAGKIYIIPYGMSFTCGCPESMKKLFFHFNLRCANGGDIFDGVNSFLVIDKAETMTERLIELYKKQDTSSAVMMKALLYEIIESALSMIPDSPAMVRELSEYTEKALRYIKEHLSSRLTVGEIADALFVSRQVLQKNFTRDVGKPIGKYIDEAVMEKAERYLLGRSLSLSEISERLGFCDQFYFSRRFTELHGISPLRFRKAHNT